MAGAIAQKIEDTAFSKAAASTDSPDGLFQTAPTDKGAISWSRFLAMELALADNKALTGNLAYVLNPTIANKAKSTLKDSTGAGGFIINDYPGNMLNGYPMFQSGYVPGEFESEIETDEEQAETLSDSLNPVNLCTKRKALPNY